LARVVEALPPLVTNHKYEWDSWLDGRVWELSEGKDFQVAPRNFASLARGAADQRGKQLTIRRRENAVFLQARERKPARG
jgi:hypothetical protein